MQQVKWLRNGAVLLFGVVAAFIMLEIFFRVVPTGFMDYRSNIRYIPDDAAGIKLKPNQSVSSMSTCYKISPVTTNSIGFRDKEWSKNFYDIAVLGDSYVEAAQIPEEHSAGELIEKILDVDVLNSGVSGYGTIHEFFCYRKYVARYKPRVLLLFFSGNDVEDNSCETSRMKGVLCATVSEHGEILVSPLNNRLIEIKEYMRHACRSCYGLLKLWVTIKSTLGRGKEKRPRLESAPVEDSPSKGWRITEYFFRRLNEELNANKGTLVLVPIPGHGAAAMMQLSQICQRNKIRLLLIDEGFAKYQMTFNLPKPYFGYRCDGHWNPLAHFLAANIVSKYLLSENLIEVRNKDRMLASIERNLCQSPVRVLGEEVYAQIYEGGFYEGKSNILRILGKTNRGVPIPQIHIR